MKELVNNALRHSGCRSVRVGVGCEDGAIIVTVEDDGRGFDPGVMKGDRNGLRNLRMRAEEMHARFELRSRNGGGTRARIHISMSAAGD